MRITFPRVVHAEWTKLRALRSTWLVLAGGAVLVIGFAALVGWSTHRGIRSGSEPPPTPADAVGGALLGIDVLSLLMGVFGVLLITGEYGSGLIRATLTAVPRRLPVLAAKAVALVAVAGPLLLLAVFAALAANRAFLGADGAWLTDPGVPRALLGAAAAPVAMGLLGLGIGAVLRHTAGAIATFVGALLIVPALLPSALPERLADDILPYVPAVASQALYGLSPEDNAFHTFGPGPSALVMAGWVLALLAAGAFVLARRDA